MHLCSIGPLCSTSKSTGVMQAALLCTTKGCSTQDVKRTEAKIATSQG